MKITALRPLVAAALTAGLLLAGSPPASAAVTLPADVASTLATFPTDPKAAMTSWVAWAQNQPMTTASSAPQARVNCRIDAAGVSRCVLFTPNPSGKKWVRDLVTYTLANDTTQIFKSKGAWVKNNLGADQNPFTNTDRYYSYDYWLPWLTPGVQYDAFVDPDGWYSVQEQNPKLGDDQSPVTMVKVSPDGLTAKFLQQYQDGRTAVGQTIKLQDVPDINVPAATKQR